MVAGGLVVDLAGFLLTMVWIMCFLFCLNLLKFYLAIWQNWSFGQYYCSKIEGLQIDHLLSLVIFVSVSLMRENLRE